MIRESWLRVKALVQRRRLEHDLDEELAFHLAMREEGMAPGQARRQFGNVTRIREICRELWTFSLLESLAQDLRYGWRTLRRAPVFAGVAIASLALGIGANAALFSLMDVMLLRHLRVKDAARLVEFVRVDPPSMMTNVPYSLYTHFATDGAVLADVFAIATSGRAVQSGGVTEMARVHEITGGFFPALGVRAQVGRTMGPGDEGQAVAVLSYGYWGRRFGYDTSIVGSAIRVNGEPATVVGVMPAGFAGVDRSRVPDVWLPLAADHPASAQVWIVGHLRPGVSTAQAEAALDTRFHAALESLAGEIESWSERERAKFLAQRLRVQSAAAGTAMLRWSFWEGQTTLKALIGLAGLVLLAACANLANLLVARSENRRREISIRLGIGAGRWRLVRQLLTESLLLSFLGGVLGLAVASWGHRLLLGFLMKDPETAALDFRLDVRVLGATLLLAVITCLLFGLTPALRSTRPVARSPRLSRALMPVQVALSMVLLVGAGLFVRSLRNLSAADIGMAHDNLLLMDVKLRSDDPGGWSRLKERMAALPGVRAVALGGDAAFGQGGWRRTVWLSRTAQPPAEVKTGFNAVGAGFFSTVGIPVVLGREFSEQDGETAAPVAVVNQTFARRYLGEGNPLGKRLSDRRIDVKGRVEVVGVVGDAKIGAVREETRPMVYYALAQYPGCEALVLHVRTAVAVQEMARAARREVSRLDSEAVVSDVRTLPMVIQGQLRQDRMFATLASFFALLALVLAAIGIYGAVAYRVAQRTAEIGVRIALGARRWGVVWLVMKETAALLGVGTVIGVAGAVAASRLVRSVLFGIEPSDAASLAGAAGLLLAAGVVACLLPARRAATLDPVTALRVE